MWVNVGQQFGDGYVILDSIFLLMNSLFLIYAVIRR